MNSLRWCLLWLLLCAGPVRGEDAEYGFRVLWAELVPAGETYVLNANVDYRFSEPVTEALENGVPLTLTLRFKIRRDRGWWLDETLFSERRSFIVRYHPLAKSYQILSETSGLPQNYASLSALLNALGEIRGWRALPVGSFDADERYYGALAVGLDLEALPLPLRPVAYVSPSWYLSSSWYEWPVAD